MPRTVICNSSIVDFVDIKGTKGNLRFKIKYKNGRIEGMLPSGPKGTVYYTENQIDDEALRRLYNKVCPLRNAIEETRKRNESA